MAKVYLVSGWPIDGQVVIVAAYSTKEAAEGLARRGDWSVHELGLDESFDDVFSHRIWEVGPDVIHEEAGSAFPHRGLPASAWNETGLVAFGFTPEEAKEKAWKLWKESAAVPPDAPAP